MKPKMFIDRPILAACISALILMLGIIGLVNLPMEQYPDIAHPLCRCPQPIPAPVPRQYRKRSSYPWKRKSTAWKT